MANAPDPNQWQDDLRRTARRIIAEELEKATDLVRRVESLELQLEVLKDAFRWRHDVDGLDAAEMVMDMNAIKKRMASGAA